MFTPHFFIDSVYNTKKAVIDSIYKDARLNKMATAYIDAQATFAKVLVNNSIEATSYAVDNVSSLLFSKKAGAGSKA